MTALSWTEVPAPMSMCRAVAAQDGAEPDARAVADADVADEDRGGGEPHVAADGGRDAVELDEQSRA